MPNLYKNLLAVRAQSEEFELVSDLLEAVESSDPLLQFNGETILNLNHLRTGSADQMMVVPVVPGAEQFKPGDTVTEIEPFDHAHGLQKVHGAVDRSQVAGAWLQRFPNLPIA